MKNILTKVDIKWQYALLVGLIFAVAYIVIDDNNVVSRGIENTLYYIAWSGIFATIFLALKNKTS
ncbi:MAG TPA: hypothetical protein VJ046_03035 [Candidatus Paceibacterota bacterium]|nr:hypothetical protein [Candidatus Paceibacterota bacterium]